MTVARLVAREQARLRLSIAAGGAALAFGVAAVVLAAGAISLGDARWITQPMGPLLAWATAASVVAAVLAWTAREWRRSASGVNVAAAIERERVLRAGSLRGAIEVAGTGALGRRAADALGERLAGLGRVLAPSLQRAARQRGALALLTAAFAVVVLSAARRAAPDGWRAIRHPVQAWTGSLLQPLEIVAPPQFVLRGERVRVRISAPERRQLALRLRSTGAPWATHTLAVHRGMAGLVLGPADADLTLLATDGRTTSDTVVIRVTDRPFVGDVAIRATYPAYLGRPPETIAVGEEARLPRGTVLSIRGRASTELTSVTLARGADTVRLVPDGHAFSGRLVAVESGRWTWAAANSTGTVADVPQPLDIDVIPDSAPRVEILSPARDTTVLPSDPVVLLSAAGDDHGLSAIVLRSWRQPASGRPLPELSQPVATPNGPEWSGQVPVDLAARGLEPGDELHLVLSATDNSPWRQTAASRELVLRVPLMSEQRQIARSLADSTAVRAAQAASVQRQLAQRTGDAARSRGRSSESRQSARDDGGRTPRGQELSHRSAEQARTLAKEQRALQERIRAIQRDAQLLEEQLKATGALDSVLARRLQDARSLLREALTPELSKRLEDVLKAAQELSEEDARRALENLAQQQQRLREALERSAEMLKRAALEGAMQTLRDEAREIANRERALADSISRGDSAATSAGRALGERSEDLAKSVEQLAERLKRERAQAGPPKLQSAAQHAERSAAAMQEATGSRGDRADSDSSGRQNQARQLPSDRSDQSRGGDMQLDPSGAPVDPRGGSDLAREAAEQMGAAAQALADARASQIEEWKTELTGELDRSIQETLQLAREEQRLAQRARTGAESQGLQADQSALQQGVERVGERVQNAAGQSSHISSQSQGALGEARRRVQQATEQLARSQRNSAQAAGAMEQAAHALNRAAASLVSDRDRAARASSASGFAEMIERMRELAKQQGALNAQAGGLMPAPGGKPSPQAEAQARRLARQQRALAARLEQASEGDGSGRAAELAQEMRQIADALDGARLDAELVDRQQRLLRRLLDAGLTLEKDEEDDTGERQSRAADGSETFTPGGDATGRAAVRYREPTWSELRGLSTEERRAVLEYFKRINAQRP